MLLECSEELPQRLPRLCCKRCFKSVQAYHPSVSQDESTGHLLRGACMPDEGDLHQLAGALHFQLHIAQVTSKRTNSQGLQRKKTHQGEKPNSRPSPLSSSYPRILAAIHAVLIASHRGQKQAEEEKRHGLQFCLLAALFGSCVPRMHERLVGLQSCVDGGMMSGTAADRHHVMRLWHEKADLYARSARRTHRQLGRRSPAFHSTCCDINRSATISETRPRLPKDQVATGASCPNLRTSPSLEPASVRPMDSE